MIPLCWATSQAKNGTGNESADKGDEVPWNLSKFSGPNFSTAVFKQSSNLQTESIKTFKSRIIDEFLLWLLRFNGVDISLECRQTT